MENAATKSLKQQKSTKIMKPGLYIVSTPIGNYEDITLRALRVLKECDFVICEEFKEARRLLSHYKIEKELFSLNEHNENEEADELISKIKASKSAALISDCGTPLFSDPGHLLVDLAIQNKIDVIPVPGASSI
jgi:16S rRNA (cytidine1402-2'-O)-methyltransferase